MGFFLFGGIFTVAALIAVAFILSGAVRTKEEQRINATRTGYEVVPPRVYRSGPLLVTGVVYGIVMLLVVGGSSYQPIEAGHIGIVKQYGAIVGQIDEGANFITPWQSVIVEDVRVRKAEFRDPKYKSDGSIDNDDAKRVYGTIAAASFETQDVFFDVTLNWQVTPESAQRLHREIGPDFFNVLVPTRVNQHFKAQAVKFTAVEATQKREEIRAAVTNALQAELSPFGITVVALQVDGVAYRPEFSAAIEQKQVATQEALRAQEVVAQREAEARQQQAVARGAALARIEAATGEAEAIRIEAEAQAEANQKIAESLTADLIQYSALSHLDGIQIALLPAGGNFLLDPSTLLQGTPR